MNRKGVVCLNKQVQMTYQRLFKVTEEEEKEE